MADIVNLRLVRKRKARDERRHLADENRAKHGRTAAERHRQEAELATLMHRLDLHRREDGDES